MCCPDVCLCLFLWKKGVPLGILYCKISSIEGNPGKNFHLSLVWQMYSCTDLSQIGDIPLPFLCLSKCCEKEKNISKGYVYTRGIPCKILFETCLHYSLRKYCTIVYIYDGNKHGKVVFIWGKTLSNFFIKGYGVQFMVKWHLMCYGISKKPNDMDYLVLRFGS